MNDSRVENAQLILFLLLHNFLQGGFRLQLLDHLERPVLDLTPSVGGSDFVRTDATAQRFQVRFPADFTCNDCTLRLLRQADEWSNGYRFWSCADIDIKNRMYTTLLCLFKTFPCSIVTN